MATYKKSYADLSFDFTANPQTGDVATVKDAVSVKRGIKNILLTEGFERLFQTGNDSVLVHVMGISTIDATVNYCETGETPKFFLHNTENNNEMQIPNIGRKPFIYNGNYTIP